jgi:ectoine hydroxylase-related dioxygenase (phytanoyl-CoA dioxygenase family)
VSLDATRSHGSICLLDWSRILRLHTDHTRVCSQDQWRYLSTEPRVTFYIAIDRATVETGCLHVLPTTHSQQIVYNRSDEDGSVDSCGHLRPDQVKVVLASAPTALPLELEPGEVVVLSNYIVHSSGAMIEPATAPGPRRAFSLCLMDGSTQRPDGSPLGATILFGNDAIPARLGNDPETRRGMLGATALDGLWEPGVAAAKL